MTSYISYYTFYLHLLIFYIFIINQFDGPQAAAYLESLSTKADCKWFLDATYGIHGKLGLILDDGKYMNHSLTPNCITNMKTGTTYALRDIEENEELFEDYNRFEHPAFLFPLLEKYECPPDYYDLPSEPTVIDKEIEVFNLDSSNLDNANISEELKEKGHEIQRVQL